MPRGIKGSGKSRKPAGEPGQPRRRGRKPKEPLPEVVQPAESPPAEEPAAELPATQEPAAGQSPELADAERELVAKYPGQRFVRGSLTAAGAFPEFGSKRTILIECVDCGAERRVATSDAFHVKRCSKCKKEQIKADRKAKRAEQ
jgi:hypothetical protein